MQPRQHSPAPTRAAGYHGSMLTLLALLAPMPAAAVEPSRRVEVTPAAQARLGNSRAWTDFSSGEGRGWRARFDGRTGTAQRAWGPGIPLGPIRTRAEAERAVRAFLARNQALVGVAAPDLRLRSAHYLARRDTWYVDFDRLLDGVPLWRAGVSARIVAGRLVMLGLDTHPRARLAATGVDASVARQHAHRARMVLPLDDGPALTYRAVFVVPTASDGPPARWTSFVDAATGVTLARYDALPHLAGVLTAEHDARYPGDAGAVSPVRFQDLAGSAGGATTTTADGQFEVDDAQAWTARFTGPTLRVQNDAVEEGTLAIDGADPRWTALAADAAEIDAWIFQGIARDFGERFAPEVGLHERQLVVTVNASVTCNAFFDGDLVFGIAGDGCSNVGRILDVHVHEWGHALHTSGILGGVIDITFGEGFGDFLAALHTHDAAIAPYWFVDGRPVREIATDKVYPRDLSGEAHEDGGIFAGAAWDLLSLLESRYGEDPGAEGTAWAVSAQLAVDAAKDGPTLQTVFDAYMLADDDDADLGNGTPHLCEIVDAFGRHGLGPLAEAWPASIAVAEVPNAEAQAEVTITGWIEPMAPGCVEGAADAVDVEWSIDGGATWEGTAADLVDGAFSATLPGQPDGSIVSYRAVARDSTGAELGASADPWSAPSFFAGAAEVIACADFEDGDGGFTHEVLSGRGEGADDWARGTPMGVSGDPSAAASGTEAWGNDLGVYPDDGAYRFAVSNRLSSPAAPLDPASDLLVQFHRWLSVERGQADTATLEIGGVAAWANDPDRDTQDRAWAMASARGSPGSASATVSWTLATDGENAFGGWNVDDVCLYAIAPLPADTAEDTAGETGSASAGDTAAAAAEAPPCACAGAAQGGALGWALAAAAARIRRRR